MVLVISPYVGKWSSLNIQSAYRAVNKSPVSGSRYLIIGMELYPTYIPNFLWRAKKVRFSGEIGAYTAHQNFHIWEILKALPHTRYSGEVL
jgi:hypothetical protein